MVLMYLPYVLLSFLMKDFLRLPFRSSYSYPPYPRRYLVAECVEMSGIVATLFAGISSRHYAHGNLSPQSQDLAKFLFKLAAYATEMAVFLDLGLSVFRLDYFEHYHCSSSSGP